ncbi:MerR family transcriptional regulator [Streptomyces sp. PSRA5]|uniref:MerR family transcriptional regulator n=1 Tax=Streptomyces panacea TaxID=3035064 RepID=UPI00339CD139
MHTPLYSGTEAAAMATGWRRQLSADAAAVSRQAVCNWVTRGYLKRSGLDERGRPLYSLANIARAELATRARALRLAGISAKAG